ncbi:MAG: hypothetical protein IKM32_02855 [Clostridia bacterium]|nr:hypothetical protein [Clostridia bacterium]
MRADGITEKLKLVSGKKGFGFIAIGIIAALLMLLLPSESEESALPEASGAYPSSAEYCALLEQKAERLIGELPEVKSCAVFITLENGYGYIYATDQHINETSAGKQTDKTIVLADGENGETALVIEESMPKVAGVAVVCKNASYETQYRIIELMCALFDIKSNRISVQT